MSIRPSPQRTETPNRRRPDGAQAPMALPLLLLLALLAASVAPLEGAARPAELAQEEPAADVIVVLQPGTDPAAIARAAGVRPRRLYEHVFRGFAGNIPQQALRGLRNNGRECR